MAAVKSSEVTLLGDLCLEAATRILDIGSEVYLPSAAWDDVSRKVEVLRTKLDFWKAEFEKCVDSSSDKALVEALQRARVQLESERSKLLKCQGKEIKSKCCTCWGGTSKGAGLAKKVQFRQVVGESVQDVIAAFDLIPGFRRAQEEAAAAFKGRILPLWKDPHYVPLKSSEKEVFSALEKAQGPAVVLLYGGPGQGKSSLARSVAVHYCCTMPAAIASPFEQVIFLECGAQADATAKQLELSQLLGLDSTTVQIQGPSGKDLTVHNLLSAQLKRRKILLILDDVWEEKFVKSMVALYSNHDKVKCLVTSQRKDVCENLSASLVSIKVEDIGPTDAQKILASHIGIPSRVVPHDLQGVANKLVQATAANPLALALIGADIELQRCSPNGQLVSRGKWGATSERFFQMLQTEDATRLNGKYPRGFWSAMQLVLETLTEDEEKMLVLMTMCKGRSTPEAVLRLLYAGLSLSQGANFDKLKREIQMRKVVSINYFSYFPGEIQTWSVHSLEKQYVEDVIMKHGRSAFALLGGVWDVESQAKLGEGEQQIKDVTLAQKDVMMTLGALYFDSHFAKRIAAHMNLSLDRCTNVRRAAVEPITRLLGLSISQDWTDALKTFAGQALVSYIKDGALDDQAVSSLLLSPVSSPSILSTLQDIAILETKPFLVEGNKGLMSVMAGILADKGGADTAIKKAAGTALYCLLDNKQHGDLIVSKCPDVLDALVLVLMTDSSHLELQIWATWILGKLAQSNDGNIHQQIVRYPGALVALLCSLSRTDSPQLQRGAAWTLSNLAKSDSETIREIVNAPGTVEEFVKILSEKNDSRVKGQVAIILANLAGGDGEMKLKITKCPGALGVLVLSLSADSNPDLQRHAARALGSLAAGNSETKLKILDQPGALEQLLSSLSKDSSQFLQKHAARGLANLAAGDGEKKVRIVKCPGALDELLRALAKESNSDLQEHAARAVANLTAGDADLRGSIMKVPEALETILKAMRRDDKILLQEHAANALANLAAGDSDSKLQIVSCTRALGDLKRSLSMDDKAVLQRHAARALARLSAGGVETRRIMITSPGVLAELERRAADGNDSSDLQKQAQRAVSHLKRQSSHKRSLSKTASGTFM